MSTLSNEDILKELGKNLLIYPLLVDNIRGDTIDLTMSLVGWSFRTKKRLQFNSDSQEIIIPANDVALIMTKEEIGLSRKVAGSVYSRVSLLTKGLGHVATTIDSTWVGKLLIPLPNNNDIDIHIPKDTRIATVRLHYLKSPTSLTYTINSGRPDLLSGYENVPEQDVWREGDHDEIYNKLKKHMFKSPAFQHLTKDLGRFGWTKNSVFLNLAILSICGLLGLALYFFGFDLKYFPVPLIVVYLTFTGTQLIHTRKTG